MICFMSVTLPKKLVPNEKLTEKNAFSIPGLQLAQIRRSGKILETCAYKYDLCCQEVFRSGEKFRFPQR